MILILVAGATEKIGSSIAKHLKRLGKNIRLLARDPNKLSGFPNSDKVKGDYGGSGANFVSACEGDEGESLVAVKQRGQHRKFEEQ